MATPRGPFYNASTILVASNFHIEFKYQYRRTNNFIRLFLLFAARPLHWATTIHTFGSNSYKIIVSRIRVTRIIVTRVIVKVVLVIRIIVARLTVTRISVSKSSSKKNNS